MNRRSLLGWFVAAPASAALGVYADTRASFYKKMRAAGACSPKDITELEGTESARLNKLLNARRDVAGAAIDNGRLMITYDDGVCVDYGRVLGDHA